MKMFFKIIAALFPIVSNAQQGIVWESEVIVADGSTYGNVRPRISLGTNDIPVVLFGKSGDGELFVTRGDGSGGFNNPVGIVPNGMQTYLASWTGPDIAANGNNVVVSFKAQPNLTGNIYAVRSTDGGLTFTDTIRVDNHDIGQTWMPALDMDENGNPHVTYMIFDASGGDERIAIASSLDGGATYQSQQVVTTSAPGVACDCCPPEIVTKGQYQLALFRNNETNIRDAWGVLSDDFGGNFGTPENLDELDWFITSCPATGPHGVILGDSAYVVSASRATGSYRVYVSSMSVTSGLGLNSVEMMIPPTASTGDLQNYPRISGSGDTLVMVWEEKQLGNTDVFYGVSTDGSAQTLTSFKSHVNSDPLGFQGKPDVVFKNGFVHVVYQDLVAGNVVYRRGTIGDVSGINDVSADLISVSPNPTNRSVKVLGVDHLQADQLHLVNALGQQVEFTYKNDLLTIQDNQSGIYFLQIELKTGTVIQKRLIVR